MIKRTYLFTFGSAVVSATTGFVIAHLMNSLEEQPVIEKIVELSAAKDVEELSDEAATVPELPVLEDANGTALSKRKGKAKILNSKYNEYLSTTRGSYERGNKKSYFLYEIGLKLSYLRADQQALSTQEYNKYLENHSKIEEEYKEWVDVHNHIEEVVDYDKNP